MINMNDFSQFNLEICESISPGLIPRRLRRIRMGRSTKMSDLLRGQVSFLHEYLDPQKSQR